MTETKVAFISTIFKEMNHRRQIFSLFLLLALFFCSGSANAVQLPADDRFSVNNSTTLTADEPEINVTVNNEALPNGTWITTGENPRLSVTIASATPIESVLIRVDDDTQETYAPNDTKFSTTRTLGLRDGGHQLSIIATGNTTTVYSATVVVDAIGPRINFEEPFTTSGYQPPPDNYTLKTSNITLQGRLIDRSTVERVIIEHRYEYSFVGERTQRSRYVIDNPGEEFAQPLILGPNRKNQTNGTNYVRIRVLDSKDNQREYSFRLNISDTESPNIEIVGANPLYGQSAVRLSLSATDNVGINSFGRRLGSGNATGIDTYYSENDIYEQKRRYRSDVEIPAQVAAEGITLEASDLVGNTAEENYTLDYNQFITPSISVDTKLNEMRDSSTVHVIGNVSQGRFSRVEIETITEDGRITDVIIPFDGQSRAHLFLNETLQVESYPTTVRMRVLDTTGTEHIEEYKISSPEETETPKPTVRTTEKSASPTQSASQDSTTDTATDTTQRDTITASPTVTPSTRQERSIFDSAILYILSVLPYTVGSAICTVGLYIIARVVLQR